MEASNVGIDWSITDGKNQEFLDVYPRIQWMHGKGALEQLGDAMMHLGGLFIPDDQFPNFEADKWVEQEVKLGTNNKKVKGHWSKMALISVIRMKKFWIDNNSHVHMLVCIKGLEDKGLFSLQVSGISKALPLTNAFNDHRKLIVSYANLNRPQGSNPIEPFALWFVVVPGEHEVITSKTKADSASEVTEPRLWLPPSIDLGYINKLYIGADNYKRFATHYKETETWQTQIPRQQQQQNTQQEGQFEDRPYQRPNFDQQEYTGMVVDGNDVPPSTVTKNKDDDIPF